jgi:uncharacterized Zn finger protein (UPF0148 family)
MREKNVAKTAEMLLAGGKMLPVHCATCYSPMFEYEGKIRCPVCGEKADVKKARVKSESAIEPILRKKLDQLAEELKGETDRHSAAEILELMKLILEVIEKLEAR